MTAQAVNDSSAAENSSTRGDRVDRAGHRAARLPAVFFDDRRCQRLHGLEEERDPVERIGRERAPAGEHREHDRLPQRAGRREHQPAAIAGRAVRTDTRQIVRQRLTPSAAEPSRHETGTAASALAVIATMIGRIMIVRTSVAVMRSAPLSWTTCWTDALRALLIRCCVDPGNDREDPDQPVDDRGIPASSRTTGSSTRRTGAGRTR